MTLPAADLSRLELNTHGSDEAEKLLVKFTRQNYVLSRFLKNQYNVYVREVDAISVT